MVQSHESDKPMRSVTGMIEIIVRLVAIAAITLWCFDIIRPFVGPVVWGVIIAVASSSLFVRLERALGGRSGAAATVFIIFALLLFIIPALQFSETLVTGAQIVAERLDAGTLAVPAPPDKVIMPGWSLPFAPLVSTATKLEEKVSVSITAVITSS